MSPLERWNPLTPLAAAILLVVAAYTVPQPVGATLSIGVAVLGAWLLGVGPRVTRLALAVAVPTLLLLVVMNALGPAAGTATVSIGPLRVGKQAALDALIVAMQLGAAVAALGWIVVGVPARRLTRALAQRGLPAWSAYVLVASLEAVPEARRRATEVLDAQRCRGLATSGSARRRLHALARLAGPLAVSLVSESEERALALEARGFVPGARRGALTPIPDPRRERIARTIAWAAAIGLLAWRVAIGLRGR